MPRHTNRLSDAVRGRKTRNPKSEIRMKPQIPNGVLMGISDLGLRISVFGFRISSVVLLYSPPMALRILCLGDIVGRPGRQVVHDKLPGLVKQHQIDLVIANAENIAGGSGITQNLFHKIRSYGVDVVTLGDHIYRKADIIPTLQTSERVVRPANLSSAAAGRTFTVVTTNGGVSVAVFS